MRHEVQVHLRSRRRVQGAGRGHVREAFPVGSSFRFNLKTELEIRNPFLLGFFLVWFLPIFVTHKAQDLRFGHIISTVETKAKLILI